MRIETRVLRVSKWPLKQAKHHTDQKLRIFRGSTFASFKYNSRNSFSNPLFLLLFCEFHEFHPLGGPCRRETRRQTPGALSR